MWFVGYQEEDGQLGRDGKRCRRTHLLADHPRGYSRGTRRERLNGEAAFTNRDDGWLIAVEVGVHARHRT